MLYAILWFATGAFVGFQLAAILSEPAESYDYHMADEDGWL